MRKGALFGLGVLALTVIMFSLSPLFERFFGRPRLRFPYLSRPIADSAYDALAAHPGWAKTKLEVAPGIALNGLIRRPVSSSAPWILYYPGNDASQLTQGQAFLIRLAGERDYGMAVFAYRGYDSSGGTSSRAGIAADAPEILSRLCAAEHLAPQRVHVMGFSIGGHFAVHAVRGAVAQNLRPKTLTLLASVNDIVMYHRSAWEKLSPGEDYQTAPLLADVPAPVLVLQGAGDKTFGGPEQGRAIAAALGARATYHELPDVDHVELLSDATALDFVRKFVDEQTR
jgi:dipeptidyl aminopeptidase/acylaminoacyl peptidase